MAISHTWSPYNVEVILGYFPPGRNLLDSFPTNKNLYLKQRNKKQKAEKNLKYLAISLTKDMGDLYDENYKTL